MERLQYCPWCMGALDGTSVCPSCGNRWDTYIAAPWHLGVGTSLESRYVTGRVLREDEQVVTYLGLDEILRKRVDIRMQRTFADELSEAYQPIDDTVIGESRRQVTRSAFLDQARRIAGISGTDALPAVVDLFEEDGSAFVVQDHVEGQTLDAFVRERGDGLTFDELRAVLFPVCRTLLLMHEAGIVCGSLGPEDIVVSFSGTYLVCWPVGEAHDGLVREPLPEVAPQKVSSVPSQQGLTVAVRPEGSRPVPQEPPAVAAVQEDHVVYDDLATSFVTQSDSPERFASDVVSLCTTICLSLTGRDPRDGLDLTDPGAMGIEMPIEARQALIMGLGLLVGQAAPDMRSFIEAWYGSVDFEVRTVKPKGDTAGHTVVRTNDSAPSVQDGDGSVGPQTPVAKPRLALIAGALAAVAVLAIVVVLFFGMARGHDGATTRESAVSIGMDNTVLARSDGTVWVMGSNVFGQQDADAWTDVIEVSAGGYHVLGLKDDGTVVACGRNNEGQTDIGGWSEVRAIGAGMLHSAVLFDDGTVRAMGAYGQGQCDVDGWEDINAISCGYYHTVGLRSDGTLVACGLDDKGQCDVDGWSDVVQVASGFKHTVGRRGDGTCVATGANASGQCDVSDWKDVVSIGAGISHTVALLKDGTVVATGANDYGQCDVDEWHDVSKIFAGGICTIGLTKEGTYLTCGFDQSGQLDLDGLPADGLSPAEIAAKPLEIPSIVAANADVACGLTYTARISDGRVEFCGKVPDDFDVSSWRDVVSLSPGDGHLVALHADGTVSATGNNKEGQCDVDGWTDVVVLYTIGDRTAGLCKDGTVVATGANDHGQCDVCEWSDICRLAISDDHTVGLRKDGTVKATGSNDEGQCDVDAWTDVVGINCGEAHTVALKSDGTLVSCGANDEGQCDVDAWSTITQVVAGRTHTVGLRKDGTVVATGADDYGQCDVSAWSHVLAVESSPEIDVTYALGRGNESLACGDNRFGQCDIEGKDLTGQYFGKRHTVIRLYSGTYEAAGDNADGQCDLSTWNEKASDDDT